MLPHLIYITKFTNEEQDDNTAELPNAWTAARFSDFYAVVKVSFMRNAEDFCCFFSCGFQAGILDVLPFDADDESIADDEGIAGDEGIADD